MFPESWPVEVRRMVFVPAARLTVLLTSLQFDHAPVDVNVTPPAMIEPLIDNCTLRVPDARAYRKLSSCEPAEAASTFHSAYPPLDGKLINPAPL